MSNWGRMGAKTEGVHVMRARLFERGMCGYTHREGSPASVPSQGQAAAPCLRHPWHGALAGLSDNQGVVANPCRTGLTLRSLECGETLAVNGALPRLLLYCSLSVEDANTEPRGLIIASAPTLIYGGRGMDGYSYILLRVWIVSFRARHTLRRA